MRAMLFGVPADGIPIDCGGVADALTGCYGKLPALGIAAVAAATGLAVLAHAVAAVLLPNFFNAMVGVPPGGGGGEPSDGIDVGALRPAGQGSTTTPGSEGSGGTPASGGQPYRFEPVTPGFTLHSRNDRVLPPDLRHAGDGFQPRPPDTVRPTVGHYDGRVISSGGQRSIASDLDHTQLARPDGRPLPVPPESFYRHAESVVAADMRVRVLDNADLAVDNTPCGSRQRDQEGPYSCDRLLPGMIPRGSTLTVWSTIDGGQTYYRKVYVGTGEYIRP